MSIETLAIGQDGFYHLGSEGSEDARRWRNRQRHLLGQVGASA